MYYSNKGKQQKQSFNNISVLSSPAETETTNKQKPFTRKPASVLSNHNSEKKRKVFQASSSLIATNRLNLQNKQLVTRFNIEITPKQKKQNEESKQQKIKKQDQLKRFRDIFYSPQTSSMKAINGSYLQVKQGRNRISANMENKQLVTSILTKSSIHNMNKDKSNRNDLNYPSSQFKKTNKPFAICSSTDLIKIKQERVQSTTTEIFDRSMLLQCSYCANNKLKANILEQKYKKLQEQINTKNQTIKQLTFQLQKQSSTNQEISLKLQNSIKQLQAKQQKSCKLIQQLSNRVDLYKKDVVKLNQSLKYKQMQRSMLLRYKDQFQLLTREFDKLSDEHQLLKKQNKTLVNNKQTFFGPQKNNQPQINFSKKMQNNSVYYDCQDDSVSIISLNLSEHSLDHY